jgi:hypothetical protein
VLAFLSALLALFAPIVAAIVATGLAVAAFVLGRALYLKLVQLRKTVVRNSTITPA